MSGAASLPPAGLPGLDPRYSRLVTVPERGTGAQHTWHVLDNGDALAQLGVEPVGTILCVHGNPTWSYLWRSLLSAATDVVTDAASKHATIGVWRVIAVDQLNMGFSDRTGTTRPLSTRIADLGDLTETLGLAGQVVTFGHDWGGVVSLGWATQHPHLVSGVMALNTAVHQPADASIPALLRLALRPILLKSSTVHTTAFLQSTLALASGLPAPVRAAYLAPYLTADRRQGIGDFVADIPVDQHHESFAALTAVSSGIRDLHVPALFLWGPKDPIFSDRYLVDLLQRMPQADAHRFEGAGHLIAEDVDFAPVALRWLAEAVLTGPPPPVSEPTHEAPALWSNLDKYRDSPKTALVEMAPPGRSAPRHVSWRLLATRVKELAAGLRAHGVQPGDRVSVLVPPGADLTAVLYACLRIGAVVVVADAGLGIGGLSRAVRGAWPDHVIGIDRALVAAKALGWPGQKFSTRRLPAGVARSLGVTASLGELMTAGRTGAPLPQPPSPGDLAAVLFTSGSTGPAKGVAYTHRQLSALSELLATQYDITVGTGLVAGFAPFALLGPALGATSVTPDMDVTSPSTLTAAAVADAAAAVDARIVFASPAALGNVLATADALTVPQRNTLSGVQALLSAGAPLAEPLLARVSQLLPSATIHTPYGMTEGLLLTDITLGGIRDAAKSIPDSGGVCVGVPAASVQIRISALDGAGVASGPPSNQPGVTGEIVAAAPHIKDHYDRLWVTQADSVRDSDDGTRWHRTGDVGHLDSEGRLWVEGRLPHVIVAASGVITPVGPEHRAEQVSGVARAAAVGVGPSGTQQLVLVIELSTRRRRPAMATPRLTADIRAAVGRPVAAVLVVPKLPTDIRHNSKVDRSRLARWATDVLAGGRMRRP
ncbi:MAG: hydrolase [Homoserinimonas sp.]|nr:hydrolase [Homoserinimonas sp.]